MTPDQLLPQLLGPIGTLVLALVIVWALVTERVVPRGRLEDKERDRKASADLLDKALNGYEGVTDAITERNRLERSRIEASMRGSRGLPDEINGAEDQIRRRTQ